MINYEKTLFRTNNAVALCEEMKTWSPYGKASTLNFSRNAQSGYLFHDSANAIRDIAMPASDTKLCIVEIGKGHYAVELNISPSLSYIAEANSNGYLRAGKFGIDPISNKINQGAIRSLHTTDRSFIMAALIMAFGASDMSKLTSDQKKEFNEAFSNLKSLGICPSTQDNVYQLCDFLYWGINSKDKLIPIEEAAFDAGNIVMIPDQRLQTGTFRGNIYTGTPVLLFGSTSEEDKTSAGTVLYLMNLPEVQAYREAHINDFTEQERFLIPDPETDMDVADDALVVPEVETLVLHYVGTKNDAKPFVNFSWRGVTGYGKTTGCRQIARILGKPYVVQACSDDTTTADFLSKFVPVNQEEETIDSLPSMEDMTKNPILTYQKLTGVTDMEATPQMCLTAAYQQACISKLLQAKMAADVAKAERDQIYRDAEEIANEAILSATEVWQIEEARKAEKKEKDLADAKYVAALKAVNSFSVENEGAPKFKLVEAPYAQALRRGYLVEIQEASRIRKQALVGLNAYSYTGALITRENGESFRRHPEAMVIFTDNVGYQSCRPIDPSVIRRWDENLTTTDLDKQFVMDRIERNVGFGNKKLLSDMYDAWKKVFDICRNQQIDQGSCTIIELEKWVQLVKLDGQESIRKNLRTAVINKCSEVEEEQDEIFDTVTKTCRILAA